MSLPMVFNSSGASIRQSIAAIQDGGANISLAVNDSGVLEGIVTDGDVRRALLQGCQLSDPVEQFIQRQPFTVGPNESRTFILDLMQARGMSQVPVVDEDGTLLGLHLLRELLGQSPRPNIAVILAGGRGSRLMPVTNEVPKPMLEVAGRPILERIVTHLVGFGIQRIAISVGYLHEQIEEHFGDGAKFGCQILYILEDPATPLGTGGPLAMVQDMYPDLNTSVLVLNGDLITQFNVADLLESHKESGASITIGVVSYTHEVPFGVLEISADGLVSGISEKPIIEKTVSAGIYACEPRLLKRIPRGQFMPMTRIIDESLSQGEGVSIWNCDNQWSDIGRPQDLARAKGYM
jgi:dTDP-glucose pyrophosphorylase